MKLSIIENMLVLVRWRFRWSMFIFMGILAGCSGGSGSSSGAEDVAVLPPLDEMSQTASTALSENSASQAFQFDLYRSISLTIDLAEFTDQLAGNLFVVKLIDEDLHTLYLSAHTPVEEVVLQFSVPYAQRYALLEIYSEVNDQESIFREIQL